MSLARRRVRSPFGDLVLEGDADGLAYLHLPGSRVRENAVTAPATVRQGVRQLEEYFAGRRQHFDVDLHLDGTDFQIDVWRALTSIPFGATVTYGDVAALVGRPSAFRAVGNANGKNRLPIFIPCHRVVASNGLGGYSGGLGFKRHLLELEGVSF